MAIKEIITIPAPMLKRKAHKVTIFDKEFQELVDDMVETLRAAPGVGLAAPQVDVPLRLVVIEFGDEEDEEIPKKLYVIANPEIILVSEDKVIGVEACLSIPGLVGEVERYKYVVIKGLNRQGKPIRIKAEDWLARIFQHEIDHLDGVLYTDRAIRVWHPQEDEELAVTD